MIDKNMFSKALIRFCVITLCAALLFNSLAFTVFAVDDPVVSEENKVEAGVNDENEGSTITSVIITAFSPLLPDTAVITVTEKGSLDEATALMPPTLQATTKLNEGFEEIELPIAWACGEDYENTENEEYIFTPTWDDTQYTLADELDLSTVPTITVKITKAVENPSVDDSIIADNVVDDSFLLSTTSNGFAGGTGTEDDPYLISNVAELHAITGLSATAGLFFKLTADITGEINTAICSYSDKFSGTFDGDGHTISGLKINNSNTTCQGLFAATNSATIKNVKLKDVDISAGAAVGGLIGSAVNTKIDNCSVSGKIVALNTVGGLIGESINPTITNSSFSGGILGASPVGGLIGASTSLTVTNSYVNADIESTYDAAIGIGGIVGYVKASSAANFRNVYAAGDCFVTDNFNQRLPLKKAGGIIGTLESSTATFSRCYWGKDLAEFSIGGNYTYSGSGCTRFNEGGRLVDINGNLITSEINGKSCGDLYTALFEWVNAEKSSDYLSWEDTSPPTLGTAWEEIAPTKIEILHNGAIIPDDKITVKAGRTISLSAKVTPPTATDSAVVWNVANGNIATVSGKGAVTGVSAGTTTVTAKIGDVTASCEVTVEAVDADTSEVEIFLNVDQRSGYTFQEVENMLKERLGPNVRILSNRQDINTTDLRDWHIYDHYDIDPNCWNPADLNGNKIPDEWEEFYEDSKHRSYFPYNETNLYFYYNPVYTIKDWIDNKNYITSDGVKRIAKFKEHIYSRIDDNGKPAMTFAGYGADYVSDFLFYDPDSSGKKYVDFDVDSSQIKTHTLRGTGFLVNCGVSPSGDTISGYLVYYTYTENSTAAQTVTLYRLDNVKINDTSPTAIFNGLHGPTKGYNYMDFLDIGGITAVASVPIFEWDNDMSIQIIAEPTKIEVRQQPKSANDNIANQDPIISRTVADNSLSGFGPFVDYTGRSHTCSMASSFTFSNLRMAYTSGTASSTSTLLDPYQYADFTQELGGNKKVQRYFLNFLGKAPLDYNKDEGEDFANYAAYLKLMQEENVALITDRVDTPFSDYLGSNLHEMPRGDSLETFAKSVADYLRGKTHTSWNVNESGSLTESTSITPIANPCLTNSDDVQIKNDIQAGNILAGSPYKIKVRNETPNEKGNEIYELRKPNSVNFERLTLDNDGAFEITNDATAFPAGKYTVRISFANPTDGLPGYAYFTLTRPAPGAIAYSVTYDGNGGSSAPQDQSPHYERDNVEILFTPQPTQKGFAFVGWSKDAAATSAEYMEYGPSKIMVMPSSNVTLYAIWAKTHAVMYNSMGGSSVPFQDGLSSGDKADKPTNPTLNSHRFEGWYTDENYTTLWDFNNDPVISDITLYAKWTETFTVRYHSREGSPVLPQEGLDSGDKADKPADPTRENHKFEGWYKDEAYTTLWNFDSDSVTSNIILYAKWTEDKKDVITPPTTVTSYTGGTPAAMANIRLVRGNTEYGNTTADKDGFYSFSNIPTGYYNVIITLDKHILTKLIYVEDSKLYKDKATIPPILENSVVEIDSNTADIVVGSVDCLYEIQENGIYTPTDNGLVSSGGKAEMKMAIEEKAKADMNDLQKKQAHEISVKAANNSKKVETFFDFALSKRIENSDSASNQVNEITESTLLHPIIIPLSAELKGQSEFEVYRYHNGGVDIISALPNDYGEWVTCDGEFLLLYAKDFSLYAITSPMKTTQPKTGGTALPVIPIIAAALMLFMVKFILWQYEFKLDFSQEKRDKIIAGLISWAKGKSAFKKGISLVCIAVVYVSYNLAVLLSEVTGNFAKKA